MKSNRKKFLMEVVPAVLLLCLLLVVSVDAQSPGNFFEGKTITLFAGSSAGGGTDIATRLIARHMERHMTGTRFMVVNKPGAGGMIAANELYNRSKPDGLTMSTMNTGALFGVATGNDALKFDLRKFIFVGQALDEAQTVYMRSTTPYTSFDAIRKANKEGKQPKMGAQSLDHTSNVVVKIVEEILRPLARNRLPLEHPKGVDPEAIYPAARYFKEQARPAHTRGADYRRAGASREEEFAERVIRSREYWPIHCVTPGSSAGTSQSSSRCLCGDDSRPAIFEGSRENWVRGWVDPRRGHEPRY